MLPTNWKLSDFATPHGKLQSVSSPTPGVGPKHDNSQTKLLTSSNTAAIS